MSTIVILGAGVGGISQAFELKQQLRGRDDRLVLVSDSDRFEFTPSNPWVAVGWRKEEQITVPLVPLMEKHGIEFINQPAKRVLPEQQSVELEDGKKIDYEYLVIATGPKLAFDEVPGLGPEGFTASICKTGHAALANRDFERFAKSPGPVVIGAAPAASCFGPAYEYAFILDTELRKRKIRDRVPMTFVTPEPYIGHLGLDGVGDTKGMLESELRNRHIRWITNARIDEIYDGGMLVTEVGERDSYREHRLEFAHAMVLPAFKGVDAVAGIEGLVNPRGFVIVDEFQRNPTFPTIYAVGVGVAIAPVGPSPVPVGTPKTGYMIESMVTATTYNIVDGINGQAPSHRATWNALCLADFGDGGVAFVAMPQIPPRNTNWAAKGKWVHLAKVGFEKYFLRKVRRGQTEPYFERQVLKFMGLDKIKETQ